ncbi:hypothetical protein KFU94_41685 [Chloroflexi bacterium TSY]|nr:hypothetical protein [Chloroflexi bacterium TSY]
MKKDHLTIFRKLKNGPVFLAQRSSPAAVLVSLDQWESVNNEIDDLKDIIAVLKNRLAVASGEDEVERVTAEDLAELIGDAVPA